MSTRVACAIGMACWLLSCSDGGSGSDGSAGGDGIGDDGNEALTATATGCDDVGPACGLTVALEEELGLGAYAFQITTSSGMTACNYRVEPVRFQTEAEAEAQDAMLASCAEQGSCPPDRCSGPDTVYVNVGGLTIREESSTIGVVIENVDTGAQSSKTFSPDYADHPAPTANCHTCRVASDSMPSPR